MGMLIRLGGILQNLYSMRENKKYGSKAILFFTLPVVLLAAFTSSTGLFSPGFYILETANWQVQSVGQDAVDLFLILPFLLITAILAAKGNTKASFAWAGTMIYLLYTFVIFAFDIHFNRLFLFYCILLGLTFYAVLWYFFRFSVSIQFNTKKSGIIKITGIYFLFIAISFYLLWLSEIIPAMLNHTVPPSLVEVGLPTNAVHVIDLSVFLPALFISGILLLRKKNTGLILAPALLTFCILMDITIGYLSFSMTQQKISEAMPIAIAMVLLALISLALLILFLRNLKNTNT